MTYISLQQGRREEARKVVDALQDFIEQSGPAGIRVSGAIRATYVVETQNWSEAESLLESPGTQAVERCGAVAETR